MGVGPGGGGAGYMLVTCLFSRGGVSNQKCKLLSGTPLPK